MLDLLEHVSNDLSDIYRMVSQIRVHVQLNLHKDQLIGHYPVF